MYVRSEKEEVNKTTKRMSEQVKRSANSEDGNGSNTIDSSSLKKRKVDNEESTKMDVDVVVAAEEVAPQEKFNAGLLRIYYSRLFPYEQMFKWLCYGHDPSKAKENPQIDVNFFKRREFSFTLAGDIYIRYLSFRDAEEMRKEIVSKQPHKMDLGAIYNLAPDKHNSVSNKSFQPVERELVFDIDLTDYDEIRTSASGADITRRCWQFMSVAVHVLDRALRDDFGFKDILWVYSGRRGIHCWVCDERARKLTDQQRAAVAKYLTIVEGNSKSAQRMKLSVPLHPSLRKAMDVLEPVFVENIIQEHGQGLLCDPEHWGKILDMLPEVEGLREDVEKAWTNHNVCKNADDRWNKLKTICQQFLRRVGAGKHQLKRKLMLCPKEIIFICTYPRLDVNVSTHRNHLLKSPFVIHPKTGRVCVPIDPETCDEFDPFDVPTLSTMSAEINAYDQDHGGDESKKVKDVAKTSMYKHVKYFEKNFLGPLYSRIRLKFREEAEKKAAETGSW